jgi:hypothetical protein
MFFFLFLFARRAREHFSSVGFPMRRQRKNQQTSQATKKVSQKIVAPSAPAYRPPTDGDYLCAGMGGIFSLDPHIFQKIIKTTRDPIG